jgi:hypothetical protein
VDLPPRSPHETPAIDSKYRNRSRARDAALAAPDDDEPVRAERDMSFQEELEDRAEQADVRRHPEVLGI